MGSCLFLSTVKVTRQRYSILTAAVTVSGENDLSGALFVTTGTMPQNIHCADQYEIIDYKVTRRLAQRPGSYEALEYRRPVVRHKPSQTLTATPAPSGLFDCGKAGREERGKMQKAYLWPVYGPQDEVVFTFSTSKSRKHPRPLLEDWQGTLLTDGNPVYDSYCKSRPEVTLAQCWTHSGRYFVRAREADRLPWQPLWISLGESIM